MKYTNFDELNDTGKTVVKSKLSAIKTPSKSNLDMLNDTGKIVVKSHTDFVNPKSNIDVLNEAGKISVFSKSPKAKELEKFASALEQDSQNLRKAFNKGTDVVGKFKAPSSGKGKLGALALAITMGSQLLKGEPVHANEMLKAGVEALNPTPFGMDEISEEMNKMDPLKKIEELKAKKQKKELPPMENPSNFGKYLQKMGQNKPSGLAAALMSFKKK